MSEYAPPAIFRLFDKIQAEIPAALMAGIVGDQAHTYGYHRARNYLPPDDYSVQLQADRAGDGEAAAALDISWTDGGASQQEVSRRLLDAANDSRMHAAREFYGSTDGRTVCGWDYAYNEAATSDDTHLWHIHLSILREYANDDGALDGIARVMTGRDSITTPAPPRRPWPGPQMGDPDMIFVRVVDEGDAIYALGPGYEHHCSGEEWGAANAAGFDARDVNRRQRDVLFAMVNAQAVKVQ